MSPFRLFLVCAALTYLKACTNCTDTIDDAKVKTAWQQYDEASRANNLDQTLAIIDNLESLKGIITPRANYLRAIAYDRAWLMQLAEHYFKSAYEGFNTKTQLLGLKHTLQYYDALTGRLAAIKSPDERHQRFSIAYF